MRFDITKLSSTLFWDVSIEAVDWNRHRKWLVQRILHQGLWEDWLHVRSALTIDEWKAIESQLKLAPRERNFLTNWIRREDAH